jgi:short-subunit dehydrogenase
MLSVPGSGIYCATKHAVVAISECLHHELSLLQTKIGVSVLCPAFVKTGIADSERLRPADAAKNPHPMTQASDQMAKHAVSNARITVQDVARDTLQAVKDQRFYIFTHERIMPSIEQRFKHILKGLPPHNSLQEKK